MLVVEAGLLMRWGERAGQHHAFMLKGVMISL